MTPQEQRRCADLAAVTSVEDPAFVHGLRAGRPCPPWQYRLAQRCRMVLMTAAGSLFAVAVAMTGTDPALAGLLLVGALCNVSVASVVYPPPTADRVAVRRRS
jgi:hypothetical protein